MNPGEGLQQSLVWLLIASCRGRLNKNILSVSFVTVFVTGMKLNALAPAF